MGDWFQIALLVLAVAFAASLSWGAMSGNIANARAANIQVRAARRSAELQQEQYERAIADNPPTQGTSHE